MLLGYLFAHRRYSLAQVCDDSLDTVMSASVLNVNYFVFCTLLNEVPAKTAIPRVCVASFFCAWGF